jgi:hypothetical protein
VVFDRLGKVSQRPIRTPLPPPPSPPPPLQSPGTVCGTPSPRKSPAANHTQISGRGIAVRTAAAASLPMRSSATKPRRRQHSTSAPVAATRAPARPTTSAPLPCWCCRAQRSTLALVWQSLEQVADLHRAHTSGFCSALQHLSQSVALLSHSPAASSSWASGESRHPCQEASPVGQRSCRRRIDGKTNMANNGQFGGTVYVFFQRELWGVFLKKNTRPTVISARSVRPYKEYRKRSLLRSRFFSQCCTTWTLAYRIEKFESRVDVPPCHRQSRP